MDGEKKGQEDLISKKISWMGTITLLILLVLFLGVTLFSNNKLTSQIRLLTEHPFTVNGDIGDVKTDLALMRIRTERLQSYNQSADIDTVRIALNDIYSEIEDLIEEIDELYLGPDEHVVKLRNTYNDIKEEQSLLLQFAERPSSSGRVIADYEEENLYPLYEEFETDAQQILNYVRKTQQNIFISANHMSWFTVVGAFIIMIATSLSLIFSNLRLGRSIGGYIRGTANLKYCQTQ